MVCGSIPAVNPSIVSQDFVRGLSKAMLKCWQGGASSKLGVDLGDESSQEDIEIPGCLANLCVRRLIDTACTVAVILMFVAA